MQSKSTVCYKHSSRYLQHSSEMLLEMNKISKHAQKGTHRSTRVECTYQALIERLLFHSSENEEKNMWERININSVIAIKHYCCVVRQILTEHTTQRTQRLTAYFANSGSPQPYSISLTWYCALVLLLNCRSSC